jgi:hypothetical protein
LEQVAKPLLVGTTEYGGAVQPKGPGYGTVSSLTTQGVLMSD